MSKIIRWGILGTGGIAHKFAEGLKHVSNAELVAIGSRNYEQAQKFGQQYNAKQFYGSYEELAASKDVDVIYIATPHVYHCANTLLCLENNKAVLCEKPFAMDSEEVAQMISKAKEKGLFLMEALWTRFMPSFLKVQELLKNNAIGEIIQIKSDFSFHAPYDLSNRFFNKALGGGTLLDIGIYPVFLITTLFGKPDKIQSMAHIGKSGVDESIAVNFYYKNGTIASMHSTFLAHTATETEIYGTKGYIKLPRMWFFTNEVILGSYADNSSQTFKFEYPSMGYEFEAQEVTNCLLQGKLESELFSLQDSIALMEILDEIRRQNNMSYK